MLATPVDVGARDQLNRRVKRREVFRPFAPAVLDSELSSWFSGVPDSLTAHMTTVRTVSQPERLPAVTHVDGTARVQSVGANEPLEPILKALEVPVVLNTSLNAAGEPMAGTGVDALGFFIRNRVDALFVDDVRIVR